MYHTAWHVVRNSKDILVKRVLVSLPVYNPLHIDQNACLFDLFTCVFLPVSDFENFKNFLENFFKIFYNNCSIFHEIIISFFFELATAYIIILMTLIKTVIIVPNFHDFYNVVFTFLSFLLNTFVILNSSIFFMNRI